METAPEKKPQKPDTTGLPRVRNRDVQSFAKKDCTTCNGTGEFTTFKRQVIRMRPVFKTVPKGQTLKDGTKAKKTTREQTGEEPVYAPLTKATMATSRKVAMCGCAMPRFLKAQKTIIGDDGALYFDHPIVAMTTETAEEEQQLQIARAALANAAGSQGGVGEGAGDVAPSP